MVIETPNRIIIYLNVLQQISRKHFHYLYPQIYNIIWPKLAKIKNPITNKVIEKIAIRS